MRTTFLIALVAYVAVVAWGFAAVEAADPGHPQPRLAIANVN
jgi:hypothetical protein